jgi:hypothetical protein
LPQISTPIIPEVAEEVGVPKVLEGCLQEERKKASQNDWIEDREDLETNYGKIAIYIKVETRTFDTLPGNDAGNDSKLERRVIDMTVVWCRRRDSH